MPDDTRTCTRCSRPTAHDGARLCGSCLEGLIADLRYIDDGEIYADLLITRTKQDAISGGQARVSGSRERPLGYRPGALTAADELTMTLRFWARTIAGEWEERLHREFAAVPDDGEGCARWLLCYPNAIRYSQHAADMADQIGYAISKARKAVDRMPEKRYAGACRDCGVDLYVREQATHITCPGCGATCRADQRWGELLAELRDRIATAADIAAGVGRLHGSPLSRKTINQWHARGRLLSRAHSAEGHPMFRIGDVLDLARRQGARKITRVSRRPSARCVTM